AGDQDERKRDERAEQAERPADDSEWEPQEPADDAEYREQYADHDEGGETERCEYDQLDHFRTSGTGPLRRRTPAGPGNSVQWVPRRVAPSGFLRPCWTACCRTPLDSLTSAPVPRPGRRRLLECQLSAKWPLTGGSPWRQRVSRCR